MTNAKSTKRSLLTSAVALVICFAMLIGTTFAWFTDSVTSANNVIMSGNLDIELEYWNGEKWVDVSGKSDILTNTLWEPGTTEVAYLRVTNAGSLALKYQLGINVVSETAGVNAAGDSFLLSDYILFGVVEGVNGESDAYANRDDAVAAVENAQIISAGYGKSSTMLSGDELYLALVVYMPTTVGNEANHNGTDVPKIELGINVLATQFTYEDDSFDENYDANAELVNVIVSNEAEFVAALAEAKNGDVIGIEGNVTWTTGAGSGSTPFGTTATYITLQGIGENPTFTAIGKGVGPVGIDGGTVFFKDLTIVDESVSYAESSWEFGYLEFRGNTVFENCDIVNAVMMEGESAKFVGCSLNSHDSNQYAVWVSDGTASFENCHFTGARGLKVHEAYGSEVVSVSVNNCTFYDLTKKPGVAIGDLNADSAVSITNSEFVGTQPGDQGNYKYETDTDTSTFAFVDENNTVLNSIATNSSELQAALENDTAVFLPEGSYTLSSLKNYSGVTIVGAADGSTKISGVNSFNFGEDTKIKNVTFTTSSNSSVRYATTSGDVVYENCVFEGKYYGYHVDNANGGTITFNNCVFYGRNALAKSGTYFFNDCTFEYTYSNYNTTNIYSEATFNNCKWKSKSNSVLELSIDAGAKAIIDGDVITQRVIFIADAKGMENFQRNVNSKGETYAGITVMLSADIDMNEAYYATWTPIGQTGATQFMGTFDGHGYTISNLKINSSSKTGAHYSTGLFGWLNKATVKNVNVDNATVIGNHNVGVIAGYMETAGCTISNCNVTNSTVTATHATDDVCGDKIGVIVGHAGNTGVVVENCTATDCTVVAGRDAGQIAGAAKTANVVGCSATNVTVTADGSCTGANVREEVIGRVL